MGRFVLVCDVHQSWTRLPQSANGHNACTSRLLESYSPTSKTVKEGGGLSCDLVAIGGKQDTRISRVQLSAWGDHALSGFCDVWLDNCDHRYIVNNPDPLLDLLINQFLFDNK